MLLIKYYGVEKEEKIIISKDKINVSHLSFLI